MKKYLQFCAIFALLFSLTARADTSTTGGARVLENPTSDGNFVLRINDGGTKFNALSIIGSTSNVDIGTDSGTAGELNIRRSNRPIINWYKNGTARFTVGVASAASDIITGISNDDVALRINNTNFHVSTNDGTSSSLSVSSAGAVTLGATGFSGVHVFNGFPRFEETLGWSFGSQRPGLYYTATGTSVTCTSQCGTDSASHGLVSGGLCLAAWTSGNAVSACGTALTGGKCLCAAID